jgi:hypothetical protein
MYMILYSVKGSSELVLCVSFYIQSRALQSLCCVFDSMPNQNGFFLSYLMLVPVLSIQYKFLTAASFLTAVLMLEHLCVDLEQESKEALATWVLVQIYTQSSFFACIS